MGAVLLSFSNTNNMFVSSLSCSYTICIVQMVSVMTSHGLQWDGPHPLPNIIISEKNKNKKSFRDSYGIIFYLSKSLFKMYSLRLESLLNRLFHQLFPKFLRCCHIIFKSKKEKMGHVSLFDWI